MRLEEIINKHRENLNDTDMVIWKYILNHRSEARHISIHELARDCAVSSTTIVRFAQKLGFDGFGELKAVLKMETAEQSDYSADVLNDLGKFYRQIWDKLSTSNYDDASRLIHESNRVFAFASTACRAAWSSRRSCGRSRRTMCSSSCRSRARRRWPSKPRVS